MLKKVLISLFLALAVWMAMDYRAVDQAQTLSIGGPFEFKSQELSKDGFIYSRFQVIETLVEVQEDGTMMPKLATGWEVSDDGLTWRFDIRQGVTFHDGNTMDAKSVELTLENATKKPGVIHQLPLKDISTEGETVVIELDKPYRPILAVLSNFSTGIVSPATFNDEGVMEILYGTGPYKIHEIATPHKLNVERFDEYWGENASIKYVHYLTGHRPESRALQAKSGQADMIFTLDPASMDMLKKEDSLWIHSQSIPRTVMMKVNNEHPFLNTRETRQALSLALDRTGLADNIVRVPGSEAYQIFPPALASWHVNDLARGKQDIAKAKQLLADQGWVKGDDGILVRDGERFALSLMTYADRPELPVLSTAIQAQLKEIGIDIDVNIANSGSIPSSHHDGSLELALMARNLAWVSDPLALVMNDARSHKGSDWGPMNWSSAELNQLLQEMVVSVDDDEYLHLAQKAARLLADEMPMIPVTFYSQQVSVNKRVKHFRFDPFEHSFFASEMSLDQ
ncbi:ABC transporter substrate-binding protein [Endozoicomonas sp. (ex Bugula neritina AB1)]|nr:ABC transporter substrate-binding protein [Endozoicomonas sp. (ex Bugula neritina AB1)]